MEKSSDALRTISEVAEILDVPKHVLRFWESKFSQINPMKRGGGRRYYRPSDIELLTGIRNLLYGEGFTIRGVHQILKREGVDYVKSFASNAAITSTAVDVKSKIKKAKKSSAKAKKSKQQDLPEKSAVHPKQQVLLTLLEKIESCRKLIHAG